MLTRKHEVGLVEPRNSYSSSCLMLRWSGELNCDQMTFWVMLTVVDLVLIMSVNPGFGGQSFIESQVKKISDLRRICAEKVWFFSFPVCICMYIFYLEDCFLLLFFFCIFKYILLACTGSKSMDWSRWWSWSQKCI